MKLEYLRNITTIDIKYSVANISFIAAFNSQTTNYNLETLILRLTLQLFVPMKNCKIRCIMVCIPFPNGSN